MLLFACVLLYLVAAAAESNSSQYCNDLWRTLKKVHNSRIAGNTNGKSNELCSADWLTVSGDKPAELQEDCESPSKCDNGTFLIKLSVAYDSLSLDRWVTFLASMNSSTQLGRFSLTADGAFSFRPLANAYGHTSIDVAFSIRNSSFCSRSCSFQLHIVPHADLPKLFILNSELKLIGRNLSDESQQTADSVSEWLTVEQNTGSNAAYQDLQFVFGAFDADLEAQHYLSPRLLSQAKFGKLFIERSDEVKQKQIQLELADSDCQSPQSAFHNYLCLPQYVIPHTVTRYQWMFTTLRYQPHEMYSGADWFEIAVEKSSRQHGTRLYQIRVQVAVLENRCQNNGTCVGHALHNKDLLCKSHVRMTGFYRLHYRCQCPADWSGSYCEHERKSAFAPVSAHASTMLSSSSSSVTWFPDKQQQEQQEQQEQLSEQQSCQCERPLVCVGGKCECPETEPQCDQSVKPWQTAMIVVFGGIIFVCVTIAVILYSQKVRVLCK